ncbi:ABC transporter permease [Kitasatospora kifunensis]|uniref:Putative ABC transport system permease protein n=1 Tax=Kitasatospora kifunensis TaxID=58351 RepID=A0A7W7R1W4_KITKI|nr:ABC transporter permease [Kitasatospora kifunensis]MBB4923882.1 putative ABC transport system permease protein [Kitasatospora kifunensis]
MYRTALRNVLAHKGRLLMTALAVLLGTAFVAGTMVFSDTFGSALTNSYSKSYTDLAVQVTDNDSQSSTSSSEGSGQSANTEPHLTATTVSQLAALPGVAQARGVVENFAAVADKQGKALGQGQDSFGANYVPNSTGTDSRYPMAQGRGPQKSGEIALDKQSADKAGYRIGDTVRVATNGPALDTTLTGIFTTDDPKVSSGDPLVLFDTATAQRLLLTPGQFSAVSLTAAPGTSQSALQDEVLPVLPKSNAIVAQTADQLQADQRTMVSRQMSSVRTMLLAFAGISLFVGIFIIANTFTMLVAQRTRELALLRAIGASRKQVTRSVLLEALLIGVFSSVAGLLAGIGIGAGMQTLISHLGSGTTPTGPLVIAPTTVLTALLVGVLVTVVSALLPARRAARIAPVAAMASGDQPTTQKGLVVRNSIGGVIAGGGLALILWGAASGSDGKWIVAGGAAAALIGTFILTPLLSRPLIALIGPALGRLFGVSGKLARQNAVRNPRRTAATASALTIGLTLVSALTVLGASMNGWLDGEITKSLKADYSVQMSNGLSVSPTIADQIAKTPGVVASSPVNNAYLKIDGQGQPVTGIDPAQAPQLLSLTMQSGSLSALTQGQLLVDASLAKSRQLAVGSALPIAFPDGTTGTLKVGGIYTDNMLVKKLVMSNAALAGHGVQPSYDQVLVKGAQGESSTLEQALVNAGGNNPLIQVQSQQDLRNQLSSTIAFALNMLYGLLAMSVLVAVLGVVNTMAMSVFERKREIGMLRAIGLNRSAVKRMVQLESVVISLFGAVLGLALGCFLAWAVNGTLKSDIAGLSTVLPYGKLLVFLALAAVVGLVAAIWPARRAAKLDILDSIKAA